MPETNKRLPLDPMQSAVRALKIATGEIDEQPDRRTYFVVVPEQAQAEAEKMPS